jgi:apolipoprotein D and lipocalin family protein
MMGHRVEVNQYNRCIRQRVLFILTIVSVMLTLTGCFNMPRQTSSPLEVVPFVDLNLYTGVWYEIARYPNSFQEGCVGSKATYAFREDGKISVLNECYDKSFDGRVKSAKGKAWSVDKETNAKLKVSFFWFFTGDYWIIDLGENYEYAVIGHPKRKYLWVLSRTSEMDGEVYEKVLDRLRDKQYDTSMLIKTPQRQEKHET